MLSVHNLSITFTLYDVGLVQKQMTVITDLDLEVKAGEVVAVVGASGSGKSLLAHAVLGILPHNAHVTGEIWFKGERLTTAQQTALRGKQIALIPQSVGYLDPLQRVGEQVRRAAELSGLEPKTAESVQSHAFQRYGLEAWGKRLFPFQVSGGMARRVLMATATIGRAALLIADEPTPGLHPEVVIETLNHLRELADEGKGVILITHDLEAALRVADKVAVFYAGTTVEVAQTADFQNNSLRHPYTQSLWKALPQNGFEPLPGSQPAPDSLPIGCLFAERCPLVTAVCHDSRPLLRPVQSGLVRCVHA